MMSKQDLILSPSADTPSVSETFRALCRALSPLRRLERIPLVLLLARIYGDLLGEKVSPRRTLHLLHVQVAAVSLLLPAEAPILFRLAAVLWLLSALRSCRRAWH